jgi:hypothetical protein
MAFYMFNKVNRKVIGPYVLYRKIVASNKFMPPQLPFNLCLVVQRQSGSLRGLKQYTRENTKDAISVRHFGLRMLQAISW